MKTEQQELTLDMPNHGQETFRVLRAVDGSGDEMTWEMHGFMEEVCPPMHFPTKEEYQAYTQELGELFMFPEWEDIAIPGVGVVLNSCGEDLYPNEIHQWLFDILYEMRTHLDGFKVNERVHVDTGLSRPNDPTPMPEMTIGLLLHTPASPNLVLDAVLAPETAGFENPEEGMKDTMWAFMQQGHKQVATWASVPIIWNITQNNPNVFRRGDRCKVRFVNSIPCLNMIYHPEWVSSWKDMPFSQVWELWK
ncbi:MAG: hypothetical protein IJT12_03050 [Paludibacteraceae bacterium]|nr:hypothetical protein [Paludibacteraceae bacterium]